jgi:hypothetical protein
MRNYFLNDNRPEGDLLPSLVKLFDEVLDNMRMEKVSSSYTREGVLLDPEQYHLPMLEFIRHLGSSLVSPKSWTSLEDVVADLGKVMRFLGRNENDPKIVELKTVMLAPLGEVMNYMGRGGLNTMTFGNVYLNEEVSVVARWRLQNG